VGHFFVLKLPDSTFELGIEEIKQPDEKNCTSTDAIDQIRKNEGEAVVETLKYIEKTSLKSYNGNLEFISYLRFW